MKKFVEDLRKLYVSLKKNLSRQLTDSLIQDCGLTRHSRNTISKWANEYFSLLAGLLDDDVIGFLAEDTYRAYSYPLVLKASKEAELKVIEQIKEDQFLATHDSLKQSLIKMMAHVAKITEAGYRDWIESNQIVCDMTIAVNTADFDTAKAMYLEFVSWGKGRADLAYEYGSLLIGYAHLTGYLPALQLAFAVARDYPDRFRMPSAFLSAYLYTHLVSGSNFTFKEPLEADKRSELESRVAKTIHSSMQGLLLSYTENYSWNLLRRFFDQSVQRAIDELRNAGVTLVVQYEFHLYE